MGKDNPPAYRLVIRLLIGSGLFYITLYPKRKHSPRFSTRYSPNARTVITSSGRLNPCRVLVWTTIYCNIVSFSPESFYGYLTLKDNLDVNSIYPTSSATVYQDTVAALKGLKNGGEC